MTKTYEIVTITNGYEYINLQTTDRKVALDTYVNMIINESAIRLRIDGRTLAIAQADRLCVGSKQKKRPRLSKANSKEKKAKKELTPEEIAAREARRKEQLRAAGRRYYEAHREKVLADKKAARERREAEE